MKWLFTTSEGHFALSVIALAICGLVWLGIFLKFGPGPATPVAAACGHLFQLFLTKVRS